MGTVWSIVIATDTGVRTIPPIFARAARTMGSRPFHRWVHVILPASLPLFDQWNETGLGVCLAFIDGGRNLCHDFDRVWSWPSASLRSRTKRNGPTHRHHAGDRRHRFTGGQDLVLALGAVLASPLGNRSHLSIIKCNAFDVQN